MTRQVTDNLYIDLEYFTPEEYYTYEAEAEIVLAIGAGFECVADSTATVSFEAALSSEFSTSTSAQRVAGLSIDLVSEFAQTVTISHIEGADLFAFAEASLAAAVSRIRDNNIEVTAVFDVGVDAVRIQQSDALVSSAFTVSATALRSKSLESAMNAAFSFSASALRVSRAAIAFDTATNGEITTAQSRFGAGSAGLKSTFTTTAETTILQTTVSALQDPATYNWTFDYWRYQSAVAQGVYSNHLILAPAGMNLRLRHRSTENGNQFNIEYTRANNTVSNNESLDSIVVPVAQWNHYRLTRQGETITLWLNGTKIVSALFVSSPRTVTPGSLTPARFYAYGAYSTRQTYLDEVRLYTGNLTDKDTLTFTPPSAAFVNDTSTRFLLHLDTNTLDDNLLTFRNPGAVTMSSAFTATVNTQQFIGTSAALSAAATVNAQVSTVIEAQISMLAMASQLTAAIKNVNELADLTSSFALTVQVEKIKFAQADLTSEFTFTAEALDLDLASAALSSEFALTAVNRRVRTTSVNAACTATLAAQGDVTFPNWRTDHWIRGTFEGIRAEPSGVYQHLTTLGVAVDLDGNVYELISRWTEQTGPDLVKVILVKRNPKGTVVFKKTLPGHSSISNSIENAKLTHFDDNLYLTYNYFSGSAWAGYVSKINLNGDRQWAANIFRPVDHYVDSSGIYVLEGLTTMYVQKMSLTNGQVQWGASFEKPNNVAMQAESITGDDDFIYFASADPWLFKANKSNGSEVWRRRIYDSNTGSRTNLQVNTQDQIVLTAENDLFILNQSGAVVESREYDTVFNGPIVINEETGGYYLGSGNRVIALDQDLEFKWSRGFSVSFPALGPRLYSIAYNERFVFFAGIAVDLDLGASPTFTVKLLNEPGDYSYNSIPARAPYSEFTFSLYDSSIDFDPLTATSTASGVTGTYSLGIQSTTSTNNTNWSDETLSSDYIWINVVNGVGAVSSAFAVTAIPTYIRQFSAALSSQFNTSINANKISRGNVAVQATSQLSALGGRLRFANSNLTSTANLGVINVRSRDNSAAMVVESTMVTAADRIRNLNADISSEFTLSAEPLRIKTSAVSFESIASQLTVAVKTGRTLVTIESQATVTAIAERTASAVIELDSEATVDVESTVTVQGAAALSSEFTVAADVDKIKPMGAELFSAFAANVSAIKTTDIVKNLAAESTFVVAEQRFRLFDSAVTSESTVDVTALKARTLQANINSEFTVFASVFNIVQGSANLQSQGFVLTVGRVLNLDPYLTYIIPEETRYYVVTEESREFKINQETRTLIL